jgi:peptide/nickel transport system substrate-binding protein
MALNRSKLSTIAESGYSPPVTNLLGVTQGMQSTWATPALEKQYPAVYNPSAAEKLLLKAGFKKGAGGMLMTPKGTPFTVTMDVPTPYTDFVALSEIIASDLHQIGINVQLQDHSGSVYSNDLNLGEFDMAVSQAPWGQTPFFTLYPIMSQQFSAPIGKYASNGAFGRYINASAEKLGAQYLLTNSIAKEVPLVRQMEQIFASQLPAIPLLYRNTPIEYSTQHIAGWPTAANPYWNMNHANLPVLVNLYWKSK